jgi:hypothetical protein
MNLSPISNATQDVERWVAIDDVYEVSDHGRVRSVDRTVMKSDGKAYFLKGRLLVNMNDRGYMQVSLGRGKNQSAKIHRLVALAFIPNPENKITVNHIDGNKSNNHVSNLEWATYKENNNHAQRTGLWKPRTALR